MRILTFTSLFPNQQQPNSAIFIKNRMAAVNRLPDVEVRVVAPVPWFPKVIPGAGRWQQLAKVPTQEQIDGLTVWHPRYLVTPKIGMSLYGYSMFRGCLRQLKKIYAEWPFDVIDAHYVYPDGLAAVLLGRYFDVPVITSARGTDMNLYPKFRLIQPLVRKVLNDSTALISVCQSLANIMVENGADSEKVTSIPNGVDLQNFKPVEQGVARKSLGFDPSVKMLLSVGGLIERKGHHFLIEALVLLKQQQSLDFKTFIVGQGVEKNNLQQQIDRAGLSADVTLVGEIDNHQLGAWYSAADLFFLGSSREGWPNVVSEALACGTPVVATPVNGIPEIITSAEYGIIVERDAPSFATGIKQAFQATWDRRLIAAYGKKRTWDVVAEEVLAVFEKNVAQADKPAGRILYHHRTQGQGAEGSHIRGMVDGFRQLGYLIDIIGPPGVDPYSAVSQKIGDVSFIKKTLSRFADNAPQIFFELMEVFYNIYSTVKLLRQAKRLKYEFIYERYALNSLAGTFVSKITKLPLVLEVNDATVIERSRLLVLKKIAAWHEAFVFSQATLIITITNQFKKLIDKKYPGANEKILVLPNAIDPGKFKLDPEKKLKRGDFNIPAESIVLGCVGAFVLWHGLEFLVETLASVAKDKNLFFLFVGDGPVKVDVLSCAQRHGIKDRVFFTGFFAADLVPYYLDMVDICVIPESNTHCSPMKLFEYMAMAKPIILPEYQPLLDTITDRQQGLFFQPKKAEELTSTVVELCEDKQLRERLGSNGLKSVTSEYTWLNNCECTLNSLV